MAHVQPTDIYPPSDLAERRVTIRQALRTAMLLGNEDLRSDRLFNHLALQIFRYQVDANPVYRSLVQARHIDPSALTDWRDIPPVPARAFKELPLLSQDPRPVEATFRTSGTTTGLIGRGVHQVRDLSLYRDSLISTATRYLRPELQAPNRSSADTSTRMRILCLTPDLKECPDSSLIYMLHTWIDEWDDGGGCFLADPEWHVRTSDLREAIERSHLDKNQVLIAGTAFSFMHVLDRISKEGFPPLTAGSMVVETGGFKGRSRTVSRVKLYKAIADAFGISMARIVNEYGMTELLSQFYEPILLENGPEDPENRRHLGPPWVRTRILNPHTLHAVPSGHPGILCHIDLANLDSVAMVLTEDLAVAVGEGFRILGRAQDATPRGCSLIMEELLSISG